MKLQKLQETIQKNIENKKLIFSSKTTGLKTIDAFLENAFSLMSLDINETLLELKNDKLELKGKTNLLEQLGLLIGITFSEKEDEIDIRLEVYLPLSHVLKLPNVEVKKINILHHGTDVSNIDSSIGGQITVLDETDVSFRLNLPVLKDVWYISTSATNIKVPSINELSTWLKIDGFTEFLPKEFGTVENLSIAHFGVLFQPSKTAIQQTNLEVTAEVIRFIPNLFAIEKFKFAIQINYPFEVVKRSFSGSIEGVVKVKEVNLPVYCDYASTGDATIRLATMDTYKMPSCKDLLVLFAGEEFVKSLPDFLEGLGNLTLERLEVKFNVKNKKITAFGFYIHSNWDIIPEQLQISNAGLSLDVKHPMESEKRKIAANVEGTIKIGSDLEVFLGGNYQTNEGLVLKGGLQNLSITDLAEKALGENIEIPSFIPAVSFKKITAEVNLKTGMYDLNGKVETTWELEDKEIAILLEIGIKNTVQKTKDTSNREFTIQLTAINQEEKLLLIDGLELKKIGCKFSYNTEGFWTASGDLEAFLFENKVDIGIEYKYDKTAKKQTLKFVSTAGRKEEVLLDFEGLVKLYGSTFSLSLEKEKAKKAAWKLDVASGLEFPHQKAKMLGNIGLKIGEKEKSIQFKVTEAQLPIPLFGDLSFEIKYAEVTLAKKDKKWEFMAESKSVVKGLPAFLYDEILPETLGLKFQIKDSQIEFSIPEVTKLMEFEIPKLYFPDKTEIDLSEIRKLGKPAIQIKELSLKLGKASELSINVGLGLPEKFNTIFGVNPDREPVLEIFNTRPELIELKFKIGNSNGKFKAFCTLNSSPIKKLVVVDGYLHCDFGEYGKVKFLIPTFSTQGNNFEGKIGFEVDKDHPLSFPLVPIKKLLRVEPIDKLAELFPNKIPLQGIEFFKDNELQTNALINFLKPMVSSEILAAIKIVLDEIAKKANYLPAELKNYLNIKIPDNFKGEVAITADAGVNITIEVDKEKPLRMLFPVVNPINPALQGVTLRGFSFGTLFGGSLFSMSIDADFDQFSLWNLLASMIMQEMGIEVPAKDFHQKIRIENLFMIIIYQAGFPIPVPLFYDRLGIAYKGLEGTGFQTNAVFKKPSLDPMEILKIISATKQFFTKPDYHLPTLKEEDFPRNMNLEFKLHNCYLELPPFLGGKVLGKKVKTDDDIEGNLIVFNLLKEIANGMNSIKFFDPIATMKMIPLDLRANKVEVKEKIDFLCFSLEAQWLFASIEEFKAGAYKKVGIDGERINEYLPLVGIHPNEVEQENKDRSLVTFLRGEMKLGDLLVIEAVFGLIIDSDKGFFTRFRIAGFIQDAVYFHIEGSMGLLMDRKDPNPEFKLSGSSLLKIGKLDLFKGNVAITANKEVLSVKGDFYLFPKGSPVNIGGEVDGTLNQEGLHIDGEFAVDLGIIVLTEANAKVRFRKGDPVKGAWIDFSFFGQKNTIVVDANTKDIISVQAKLPTLNTALLGEVQLENNAIKNIKASADLFGLYDVQFHMTDANPQVKIGKLEIKSKIGLPFLVKGNSLSKEESFELSNVEFWLLPDENFPINIHGSMNAIFNKEAFSVNGAVRLKGLPEGIIGPSTIDLRKDQLVLTTFLLGQKQSIAILEANGSLLISLIFNPPPLNIKADLSIGLHGQGFTLGINGGIDGLATIRSSINGVPNGGSGAFYLDLLTIRDFLKGMIYIRENYFSINGNINFNVGPLFLRGNDIGGSIAQNGFTLGGSCSAGFEIWPVKIEIAAEARISNEAFFMSGTLGITASAISIRQWRSSAWGGQSLPTFLFSHTTGIYWFDKMTRHWVAARLDAPELKYGLFWRGWGDDIGLNLPPEMRLGVAQVSENQNIHVLEEDKEPAPLLEVAKPFLFNEETELIQKTKKGDFENIEWPYKPKPITFHEYENQSGSQIREVIFHEITEEYELLKILRFRVSETIKNDFRDSGNDFLNCKQVDFKFVYNVSNQEIQLEVMPTNKTDFKSAFVDFDFVNPELGYKELAMLLI